MGTSFSAAGTCFSPARQDVERYRSLRALSTKLTGRMVKTIPRKALDDIGDALGIRQNDVLIFETEDMTSVLMDCCLYDWYEDGKNLVQRYAETHPAAPGTDEGYLMHAYLRAKYRILLAQSVLPGAGLHCQDLLNGGELFLMDLGLSQTVPRAATLATRTIPLGEFWMTGGAGLPIDAEADILAASRQIKNDCGHLLEGPAKLSLPIIRACLTAGAAGRVMYAGPPNAPRKRASCRTPARKPLRMPSWPGFKRRR
jgi:hypothetical protein